MSLKGLNLKNRYCKVTKHVLISATHMNLIGILESGMGLFTSFKKMKQYTLM